jgi:hypothetical protein
MKLHAKAIGPALAVIAGAIAVSLYLSRVELALESESSTITGDTWAPGDRAMLMPVGYVDPEGVTQIGAILAASEIGGRDGWLIKDGTEAVVLAISPDGINATVSIPRDAVRSVVGTLDPPPGDPCRVTVEIETLKPVR